MNYVSRARIALQKAELSNNEAVTSHRLAEAQVYATLALVEAQELKPVEPVESVLFETDGEWVIDHEAFLRAVKDQFDSRPKTARPTIKEMADFARRLGIKIVTEVNVGE